jgi:hypothetical protein
MDYAGPEQPLGSAQKIEARGLQKVEGDQGYTTWSSGFNWPTPPSSTKPAWSLGFDWPTAIPTPTKPAMVTMIANNDTPNSENGGESLWDLAL